MSRNISDVSEKVKVGNYAKITRPKTAGIIQRERLFRLLDQYLGHGVTFISGPPGSGKTILMSSYVDTRRLPCLWYQLDQSDADIATFFYYLSLAAKRAAPKHKKQLPLFTPEYSLGLPTFTRRYFENLCLRLKPPYLLVFDNYQEIPTESPLHEIFCTGLSVFPDGISAVIISRSEPPANFVSIEAKNRLNQIGWNELRLTLEESKGIAQLQGVDSSQAKVMKWLHEKTDGWAAGVVLLVQAIKSLNIDLELTRNFTPEKIINYFANEIFNQLENSLQDFLLKTAFLPKVTPELAEKLTGHKAVNNILENLSRRNYFLEKRTQPEVIYQYHALFKEFLISRAATAYSPEELLGWQFAAANLLEASGYAEDAAELYIHAKAWKELKGLILANAQILIRQGRIKILERWMTAVPQELLEADPWLNYLLGTCRLGSNPSESRTLFERAFQLFISERDEAGVLLAWSGAVQTFIYEFDDFQPLDRWITWLDEWMAKGKQFPSSDIALIVAAGMTAALTWRMPDHPDMPKWVEKAITFSKDSSNMEACTRAYTNNAIYYIWMGMFDECRMLMDEMKRMMASQPVSPLRSLVIKHTEAQFYNSSAEFLSEASESVSEALIEAQKSGIHVLDPLFFNQGIICSLNEGNSQRTKEFLDKLEKTLRPGSRTHTGHYFYLLACYYLLIGKLHQALLAAQKSLNLLRELGVPVSEILARLILCHIQLDIGEKKAAKKELAIIKATIKKTGSSYFEYLYFLTEAYVKYAQRKDAEGLKSLRKAMTMGKQKEFMTMLYFWRPTVMSFLCQKSLEGDIEVNYIQNLIRKLNLVPGEEVMNLDIWPWPVKIYTLGRFQIFIDGKPIQFSAKLPRIPLLFLKLLISFGGEEIKEEQLEDILWPDADGDMAHWSLETTLHRLRKWFQNADALQVRNGIVFLNRKVCWIDVWAFESLIKEADAQGKKGRAKQTADLLEKAIALYKGPFLAGEKDASWTVVAQERLRRKFLRCVSLLGNYWQKTKEWEKAISVYGRGLEIDNIAEEFYQGLMICYHQMGRTAEALDTYERLKKIFSTLMGVKPSPKTETIRKSLL